MKLHGEAADIDLAEAETKMNIVRQKLAESGYKPENILTWTKLVYIIVVCLTTVISGCKSNGGGTPFVGPSGLQPFTP